MFLQISPKQCSEDLKLPWELKKMRVVVLNRRKGPLSLHRETRRAAKWPNPKPSEHPGRRISLMGPKHGHQNVPWSAPKAPRRICVPSRALMWAGSSLGAVLGGSVNPPCLCTPGRVSPAAKMTSPLLRGTEWKEKLLLDCVNRGKILLILLLWQLPRLGRLRRVLADEPRVRLGWQKNDFCPSLRGFSSSFSPTWCQRL